MVCIHKKHIFEYKFITAKEKGVLNLHDIIKIMKKLSFFQKWMLWDIIKLNSIAYIKLKKLLKEVEKLYWMHVLQFAISFIHNQRNLKWSMKENLFQFTFWSCLKWHLSIGACVKYNSKGPNIRKLNILWREVHI